MNTYGTTTDTRFYIMIPAVLYMMNVFVGPRMRARHDSSSDSKSKDVSTSVSVKKVPVATAPLS